MDFNATGQRDKYIFSPLDGVERVYAISMFKNYKGPSGMYDVIGTYEVVDAQENAGLTEKKVGNITKMLAGLSSMENLSNMTDTRLLFDLVPRTNDADPTVINFRTYDGDGVSKENAVLKLERGIFDER